MKLTPLDILQREFRRKAINGLDPDDVGSFLDQIAEGVAALLEENERLRRRDGVIGTVASTEPERTRDAGTEIQRARYEARAIVSDAEEQARAIVNAARSEAERLRTASRLQPSEPSPVPRLTAEYETLLREHLARVVEFGRRAASEDESAADPSDRNEEPTTRVVKTTNV
ncbi:DivIVA domain-containing protein [Candidatus Poribacteria bacterium]|nr:DivIVA domain-containing protein [Candidatus Poribacteria bacterium]